MRFALLDDLPHQPRGLLGLSGPDTRRFVQGTITADVGSIDADHAVVGALCTVKGKLVSELVVLAVGDEALELLVPADAIDGVADALNRHIIMDDVTVREPVSVAVAVAWEPGSDAPPAVPAGAGVRTFVARHPGPGRLVVGSREAVLAALAGATQADPDQWATRRIETATPAWGHEIEADVFPPEIGFVHAVSYDKGCFMGQEPLARIHARGQVNRVMVRVSADAAPVGAWAPLMDEAEAEVGRISTWTRSDSGVIGLAIVRRAVASVGQALHAGPIVVRVTSDPLGDDIGVGTKKRTATVKLGRR